MARPMAVFLSVLLFTMLSASASAQPKGPTQAELSAAAANAANWVHPNHDYGGRRFVDIAEKMFQTCGSATLSESERTSHAREGSDDQPSPALPLLPRD